jgi:hypothetical protein
MIHWELQALKIANSPEQGETGAPAQARKGDKEPLCMHGKQSNFDGNSDAWKGQSHQVRRQSMNNKQAPQALRRVTTPGEGEERIRERERKTILQVLSSTAIQREKEESMKNPTL